MIVVIILMALVSCTKQNPYPKEKEIYLPGTEWVYTEGDASVGLQFYNTSDVTFFISDGSLVLTTSGKYQYISSVKKVSFKDVAFYENTYPYKTVFELKGGQIIDDKTMKISVWYNTTGEAKIEEDYLYRK